ncbi:HAD family hydrolase [Shewanella maritima]|uniref:HAD family hydrolase n=1 Tax=Shewanella maritima TaxID=2520507 RepID=A0A411PIU7_9GAMM|nr:HAD-IA family hydrolase [Shewanella maritima]QBF83509.1 HAD family hydrolase [Shewanella maritima]
MHFYQALRPFKAISFDLDDTLYNNKPYIIAAESELLSFLQHNYPEVASWEFGDWRALKMKLIALKPELGHDTGAARLATLEAGLRQAGCDEARAIKGAEQGLAHFLIHRSNFSVPETTLELLQMLAQRMPLIGITNGNVDASRIGLDDVLEFVVHSGNGLKMKPCSDMFEYSADRLGIRTSDLLHVGDSYSADVQGARGVNAQAAWLNPAFGRDESTSIGSGLLPTFSFSELQQLESIVR